MYRFQVNGEFYSGARTVYKSSLNNESHSVTPLYNRNGVLEDPWVCMQGFATDCLYAENSYTVQLAQRTLSGFNVFIREQIMC